MSEHDSQPVADLPTERDIGHGYAIGIIERVADADTTVGDSLCEQTGKRAESLTAAEWMEFFEAVHTYVEVTYEFVLADKELAPRGQRPDCGCGTCHETNVPNATHALQQLVACESNDIDSLQAAMKLIRKDIAAVRWEVPDDA
jgi:hypothetical protein